MKLFLTFLLSLASILTFGQSKRADFTLEDIYLTGKTYPKGVYGIRHGKGGKYYTVSEQGKVYKCAYTSELRSVLFDSEEAESKGLASPMQSYEIANSGNQLLIGTETEKVYRHSKKCAYYIWNFTTKELTKVFDGKKVFYATFSPDESQMAFVFENNLYVQDLATEKVTQITKDGEQNAIINGMTDWVYEEEFALIRAFEWSPDGKHLAFLRFDESQVKEYQIPVYKKGSYPSMYTYKYPKAGEDNSVLSLKIINLVSNNISNVNIGTETDIYIPRMQWINASELSFQKLNRWQNDFSLNKVNISSTGKTDVIYQEKSDTYVDVTDDLTFIDNGNKFIISSDKSGYNHLYLYNINGKLESQLTKGNADVTKFLGYNAAKKELYYEMADHSPMERHAYKVDIKGKRSSLLTKEAGTHSLSFSKDFSYYIHTHSTINSSPKIRMKKLNGSLVRDLQLNQAFDEYWASISLPMEFFTVKSADGQDLNAYKIEPKDFDPKKEYPLLMFVYGGPGSQTVTNTWFTQNKAWLQYMALNGYYVISVDNRGTGSRGTDFKKCTYKNLGQLEVEDQIAVADQMAALPYIDKDRIGMFGWSYGGFMTSHCLARGSVFKTGVAVAPVTDWSYYDNIYTERYMRRPADNPAGYDNTRVMKFSDGLRDKNYLLVHGSFDDNVHPQNAFELMNDLVTKNIPFDSEIYVNKNHGIYGGYTRIHLFKKITSYFDEHLKGK